MQLIEIGVYAVSGVLGALVASLVVRNRENRNAFGGVTAGVAVLSGALLMGPAKTWNSERETDKALGGLKMYQVLKRVEPQLYEKVRQTMIKGIKDGKRTDALIEEVAPLMSELVPKYIVKTSDAAAISFLGSVNGGLTELVSAGGDDCYHWMYPGKRQVSTSAVNKLSRKVKENMAEAIGEVLTQALEHPQPAPDATAGDQSINQVILRMQAMGQVEGLLLTDKQALTSEEMQKVCRSSQVLFTELLKLPEDERGNAIRYNFSGK